MTQVRPQSGGPPAPEGPWPPAPEAEAKEALDVCLDILRVHCQLIVLSNLLNLETPSALLAGLPPAPLRRQCCGDSCAARRLQGRRGAAVQRHDALGQDNTNQPTNNLSVAKQGLTQVCWPGRETGVSD